VRPSPTVARVALTAALVLGALPGLVGSRVSAGVTGPDGPSSFREVILASTRDRPAPGLAAMDPAWLSDGALRPDIAFQDDPQADPVVLARTVVSLPKSSAGFAWKPPKSTVTGTASWYSAGYTAMRLPRGTIVVICGAAACIERTITDYGPVASTGRVIDLYRPDFVTVCGCWSGTGLTTVTVRIY